MKQMMIESVPVEFPDDGIEASVKLITFLWSIAEI